MTDQETLYAVNPDGSFVGTFVGLPIPAGTFEVPSAPADGRDLWDFNAGTWIPFVEPVVYPNLTARQLRLMLLNIGITETMVNDEIAAIADEVERSTAQIEWKFASTYERHHPLIDQMASAFQLLPTQVDDLWLAAADL